MLEGGRGGPPHTINRCCKKIQEGINAAAGRHGVLEGVRKGGSFPPKKIDGARSATQLSSSSIRVDVFVDPSLVKYLFPSPQINFKLLPSGFCVKLQPTASKKACNFPQKL